MRRVGAILILSAAVAAAGGTSTQAAKLPQIQATASNTVPACVTPGRLMEFIKKRNPNLASKFSKIAVDYMRHGETLKIRWDQAFYQMLVETNYLKYGKDVSVGQNNFAGLGATGGGEPGERFATVSDGVKAHLQHILMYAGVVIDNPVAERTRKVQEWGILDKWRARIGRPLTFTDLTTKWSPGDRGYSRDIKVTGQRYFKQLCNARDPHPEWIAQARGQRGAATQTASAASSADNRDFAREAVVRGKREKVKSASALGRQALKTASSTQTASSAMAFKVLNGKQGSDTGAASGATGATGTQKTAMVLPKTNAPAASGSAGKKLKCNVFTASYGGQKAMIIKAVSNGVINYTVLDVNAGKEQRETQAYIAAYAKGGKTVGAFSNQAQALDQAFKLCPEN